jgi:uncharacterized membrane protein
MLLKACAVFVLRDRFRRAVRDEVLKRYSQENVYRRLSVVYQSVVAEQSQQGCNS